MKHILSILLFAVIVPAYGQELPVTFILVRHAEKGNDGTKDPDLTEAGKARAILLAKILKDTKIDAIYSTGFKRTQNTVAPVAMAKGLTVLPSDPMKAEAIDEMIKKHAGGTVLVSGHSNTTPWLANYLLGNSQFKDFDDSDYDNLLIINYSGKGKATVTWLTY